MQKNIIGFKKLKLKIIEKRKEKKKKKTTKEERKEENSTELQKPNVEVEVYKNHKKCD